VTARTIAGLAAISILALAGCGSSDTSTVPGGADADAVRVIKDWADELRAGDVQAAADRFQVPAVVQNGTPPLRLTDRSEVVGFNESLPCGAKLTEATTSGKYTIATFELTERPGPGECGGGVGETAKTAFVIHDGRITEWRRVADINQGTPTTQGPIV
jgi:limonene-1,2-epoxide hydrolase